MNEKQTIVLIVTVVAILLTVVFDFYGEEIAHMLEGSGAITLFPSPATSEQAATSGERLIQQWQEIPSMLRIIAFAVIGSICWCSAKD